VSVINKTAPTVINRDVWEQIQTGMWAWLVQRITSILLILLLPLKYYSGYVLVGRIGGNKAWAADFHSSPIVDGLLLLAVIFHALYGLRVILIDYGWVKQAKTVFKVFTVIGIITYLAALYFVIL